MTQPPPGDPFPPGPPEHPAHPHPVPGQPTHAPQAMPGQPGHNPQAMPGHPQAPGPPGHPHAAPGQPAPAVPAVPRRRSGALIAAIVVVVALLLCLAGGVAAFFLLTGAESDEGADEPTTAVHDFLTAVYQERDAARAAALTCPSARDQKKITAKVAEIEKYAAGLRMPKFRWSTPKVDEQTDERATVSTRVTVTTVDEKITNQDLRLTVVQEGGWWVCEVS